MSEQDVNSEEWIYSPMDVAQIVHGFNGQYTFGHIESCYILGEHVVFHEHRHEIAARKELHDQVKIEGILERIEQLDHPRRR